MPRLDDRATTMDRVGEVIVVADVGASPAGVNDVDRVLAVRLSVRNAGSRTVAVGPVLLVTPGGAPLRALTANEALDIVDREGPPAVAMDPQAVTREGDYRRLPDDEDVTPDLETGRYRLGYSAAPEMEPFRRARGEGAEPPAAVARRLQILSGGVLDPAGERNGYVYFRRPGHGVRRAMLSVELRDARSGARIGSATLPVVLR